jgi:anti-sigma B factor antagonist
VALKLTTREVDGVTVVALDGRIVLGEESSALREKVKSLVAEGKKKIVLNMDNVTFIDSAGLGTLVASHHSARGQGATLKLCHLGRQIHGSPADHEADDHLRCFQHGSGGGRQLFQVSSRKSLGLFVFPKRTGLPLSFLFSSPQHGTW